MPKELRSDGSEVASASWIVEYHRIANPDADIHEQIRELFERAGYNVRLAAKVEDNGLVWAWKA